MATPNLTEYLEIDGVPLQTAAWDLEDISGLWDIGEVRGSDALVPYKRGAISFRRQLGPKIISSPMTINGGYLMATPRCCQSGHSCGPTVTSWCATCCGRCR